MKKNEMIKSNELFNTIINNGTKVSNKLYTMFFLASKNEKPFFGITASKKTGNAVIRNKLKRQTREVIDQNKMLFKNNRNYIIIIKKETLEYSYKDKLDSLKTLIGEANEK